MLRLGAYLVATATIIYEKGVSASKNPINLNLDLLSNDAWLHYGHREAADRARVSKKATKAKSTKNPESLQAPSTPSASQGPRKPKKDKKPKDLSTKDRIE